MQMRQPLLQWLPSQQRRGAYHQTLPSLHHLAALNALPITADRPLRLSFRLRRPRQSRPCKGRILHDCGAKTPEHSGPKANNSFAARFVLGSPRLSHHRVLGHNRFASWRYMMIPDDADLFRFRVLDFSLTYTGPAPTRQCIDYRRRRHGLPAPLERPRRRHEEAAVDAWLRGRIKSTQANGISQRSTAKTGAAWHDSQP